MIPIKARVQMEERESELTTLRERVKSLEDEVKRGMEWSDKVEKLRFETANNLTKSIENTNEQEVTIALLRLTVNQLKSRIRELEEAMSEVKEKLLEPGWPEDKDLPGIADIIESVMTKHPSEK